MNDEPERRLIGYARVSTDDQDLRLQERALVDYGVKPEHIYKEHASGGTMHRKQLSFALKSMREGDAIVVWKLDRLGRTLTGVIGVAKEMADEGVNLISLTEKIDTTSAMGRAFFQIALVFAELERELISERTRAGIEAAKARGSRFGQPHKILDFPKRRAEARAIVEGGLENITAAGAVERLNRADPKAQKIKSLETWRRWVRAGCPGVDEIQEDQNDG